MKLLFCGEYYAPSQGGVQKVLQEVAEHLVSRGHEVTVATTQLPERTFSELNGVRIREFEITGNLIRGMRGEVANYHRFVREGDFDAILVKAAQQWTFDALWPILPFLPARKVHIPCGYSGLYNPDYRHYYEMIPDILRQFDHLIFYASEYRDIEFARKHGLTRYSIIPNGASEREFTTSPPINVRKKLGIHRDDFLFLTVGSPPVHKGHLEVAKAYTRLRLPFPSTLLIVGRYGESENPQELSTRKKLSRAVRGAIKMTLGMNPSFHEAYLRTVSDIKRQPDKKILITGLPRDEVIAAFFASNLFIFASLVEYSPLVLFEAAAAGLPFLSVPVGNAVEIASWTGGGVICQAEIDPFGYINVSPVVLAENMVSLATDRERLGALSRSGRNNWMKRYTWEKIGQQYERVLTRKSIDNVISS